MLAKNKLLTEQNFFEKLSVRFPFFKKLKLLMASRVIVGHYIRLYLSLERYKFYATTAVKAGYKGMTLLAAPTDYQDGICVGIERKLFGSSLRLRFVNENVLVERKIPVFSQYLIFLAAFKRSKASYYLPRKAKLYYFNQQLLRKFLNIHYYQ